jgi:hypothetical protein
MKHAVAILVALFSLTFLTGGSCDSGDFSTSYFFCCDGSGNCQSDPTQCSTAVCNTGQQNFVNGQNECTALQTDASNNNCGLYSRFGWFVTIGCSGSFTEIPAFPAVTLNTPTPAGAGTVNLSWTAPTGYTSSQVVYTILLGTATGAEGFLAGGVSGTTYPVTGLVTGVQYFFTVAPSLIYAGNIAAAGVASNEVTIVSP